jgi:hypothetical protein
MAIVTRTMTVDEGKIAQARDLLRSLADPIDFTEGNFAIKIARSEMQRVAAAAVGTKITIKFDATDIKAGGDGKSNTGLLVGLAAAAAVLYFASRSE